jgi:Reverse transcriptase (RNA-dependent DNA polymerase)
LDDLAREIQNWKAEGHQIIITGDFNEDVSGKFITKYFADLQMKEIILEKHNGSAPNTYSGGTVPIDGIFATPVIEAVFSGYGAFSDGIYSDHRLLWVDIDENILLGTKTIPLWAPKARRLQCCNPKLVQKFNYIRLKHHLENKLEDKKQIIENLLTRQVSTADEELDQLRVEGILLAERKCRHLKMGHVPWSPELKESMTRIGYYQRCRLKYCSGKDINGRTLQDWYLKSKLTVPIQTGEEAIIKLKQEFKVYNVIKKQAKERRITFLETLAEARAEEGDLVKENILKQLIDQEIQRNMFRRIRSILGQFRKKVTAIEVATIDDCWELRTEKEDIERGCIEENIKRFTQAGGTPPLHTSQTALLGWKAENEVAKDILQGKKELDSRLHPSIQRMAPFLATPTCVQQLGTINEEISEKEYKYRWQKSKEYTSSGLSGIHFGHFKASCQMSSLCNLDKWFIEVAIKTGYSLTRWHQGIDVMIPKKQDSLRVDKLRTIVLMEADFNYLNKIVGRRIMKNAEEGKSIAQEQFGSRKTKSSIGNALNKLLTIDILRQEKRDFSLITLDAKSCYDRIAQPIASIALKRQGATDNMVNVMFDTISKMKRCIRTAFGDSLITYQETTQKFHGILQGNGAGPTIWIMISSPMLDRLRQKGL